MKSITQTRKLLTKEEREYLCELVSLSDRMTRRGLDVFSEYVKSNDTLEVVSWKYGVSRERVRQLVALGFKSAERVSRTYFAVPVGVELTRKEKGRMFGAFAQFMCEISCIDSSCDPASYDTKDGHWSDCDSYKGKPCDCQKTVGWGRVAVE